MFGLLFILVYIDGYFNIVIIVIINVIIIIYFDMVLIWVKFCVCCILFGSFLLIFLFGFIFERLFLFDFEFFWFFFWLYLLFLVLFFWWGGLFFFCVEFCGMMGFRRINKVLILSCILRKLFLYRLVKIEFGKNVFKYFFM